MKKVDLTIDTQLAIMAKYGLTAEEYLVIELLFLATESNGSEAYFYKYFMECKKEALPRDTLQSLKDKEVLAKTYTIPGKGENFDIQDIEWGKVFINNYFKMADVGGIELMERYPAFLQGYDRPLPAKNITTKGFLSLEAFYHAYAKSIRHSRSKHDAVMQSLEWAKEHDLLTYSIAEYVVTKKWEDHMQMQENGQIGVMPAKISTMEKL